MNNVLKGILDGANDSLGELNNAVSCSQDAKGNLNSTVSNMDNALGGQAARNIQNSIQGFSRNFDSITNGLRSISSIINAEKNDCQQKMK
ncbi:hypothetical protein SAMN02745134_03941 [Clostridium acidisoli DSM 12555]|jgi:uncharacterized protein YukE|uniref:Uncharacterized protein n=1 Tax=Clostridium acidisoli DSM 12555 TaxID=1121291 RepID=A0A1W1Y0A7_9CLOT|nr:hypothetical protein [Clostridium acidisoli]SMC29555.1 hypothetical protein SAMN02745134_03941 [Clostridium acidisoli DSM 12555]